MSPSAAESRPAPERIYAVAEFTRELLEDLARDSYRPRAWWALISRSWARSLEDLREQPARTRSARLWTSFGALVGAGTIILAWRFHAPAVTLGALALWLPWYAATAFFVLTHLGMVDRNDGEGYDRLLLPNGLTYLRLGLAPLAVWPGLSVPTHPATAPIFAALLIGLALTDILDGFLARLLGAESRMGRMLDPLADVAFLAFLAAGLYRADVLPVWLFALLLARYPGSLIAVVLLYFARGPVPLRPTLIGRVTSLATNIVLFAAAVSLLLQPSWLPPRQIGWGLNSLYILVGLNVAYLVYRAATWSTESGER